MLRLGKAIAQDEKIKALRFTDVVGQTSGSDYFTEGAVLAYSSKHVEEGSIFSQRCFCSRWTSL